MTRSMRRPLLDLTGAIADRCTSGSIAPPAIDARVDQPQTELISPPRAIASAGDDLEPTISSPLKIWRRCAGWRCDRSFGVTSVHHEEELTS
jgi:hypothetical protein